MEREDLFLNFIRQVAENLKVNDRDHKIKPVLIVLRAPG